jgi:hypothetical protein
MVDVWDPRKVFGKTIASDDFIRSRHGFVGE